RGPLSGALDYYPYYPARKSTRCRLHGGVIRDTASVIIDGMSTPRRRSGPSKGDLRERAILDAARRLVADKPLARITIDELAGAAGISRSSFYFYFDSKTAVIARLVDDIAEEMNADAAEWTGGQDADAAALRRGLTTSARLWRDHGPLLRQVLLDPEPEPAIAALRARLTGQAIDQAAGRIRRDREAGLAPPGPPDDHELARALTPLK